ncbi:OB-fold domain-containing protein [uncultured Parasphingorhabdus sp.]|uniref:Zn-ribbon domain-containing OB-fold protein n=1 Tax=uncultured Parasphingorhabdus sp. TaxID=2709694 RepID=UPI0030D6FF6A
MSAQPIADNLFTEDMNALIGARNKETGQIFFPLPLNPADNIEPIALATRGTVWTYTVQRFPPKPPYIGPTDPEKFKPYVVAYVSLPGQTMVESRLTGVEPDDVKIGMEVEFTVIPLDPDAPSDEQLLIHAFKPVQGE